VQATLDDFRASVDDPIPVFLKKAITFIEKEGLDAEGLYRVPGNRAHVDLLFQVKQKSHLLKTELLIKDRSETPFNFLNEPIIHLKQSLCLLLKNYSL
jgi:hypothetical protein